MTKIELVEPAPVDEIMNRLVKDLNEIKGHDGILMFFITRVERGYDFVIKYIHFEFDGYLKENAYFNDAIFNATYDEKILLCKVMERFIYNEL